MKNMLGKFENGAEDPTLFRTSCICEKYFLPQTYDYFDYIKHFSLNFQLIKNLLIYAKITITKIFIVKIYMSKRMLNDTFILMNDSLEKRYCSRSVRFRMC